MLMRASGGISKARSSSRPCRPLERREGELELVDAVVAGLVDARRLASGTDEEAGKQVRERGAVDPVTDQAAQQIRTAQQRAVLRRGAAERQVVAAAGAGVAT